MTDAARKPRILIVDDLPGNIKILAEILKDGYDISMVTNGQDALELAAKKNPDLILLDVVMPDMDGYEVCERLKANPETKEIPVIFVTGQGEEMDEAKGLDLGAVDYVTKPAKPAILKARVRNHIEIKQQRDALAKLSTIDGLTGVANRRHFDSFLDQEWRRGVRGSMGIALIMVDIDHFKQFNDHFGHGAGDDCLKKVATTLNNSLLRSTDLLARYGGEEFATVLPQVEHHGAERVAEKMRANIEALKIPHPKSLTSEHVTISLGCAAIFPTRGGSPLPLLKSADKMLYAAKDSGRNQFKVDFL
jgi:diguanylate cyclase (GGDEF)-like protein